MASRTRGFLALLAIALPVVACSRPARVAAAPPTTFVSQPAVLAAPVAPGPDVILPQHLPRPQVAADLGAVAALRGRLRSAVALLPDSPALTLPALAAARQMMAQAHTEIDGPQALLVVDRSPRVQRLWIVVAQPGGGLDPLGSVHVSTGKPGRKEHFRTPVGVFDNDASILGYRALGTYNENHIRGIGTAGMRVWDFGWQTTDDWRSRTALMAVRMELHATDPAVLEPRLGRWDSEGCIRIPSAFNRYLDRAGLIDAKEREAAQSDRRFAALLPRTEPDPLAGHLLVVVDTSDPEALPSDPVRAAEMQHIGVQDPAHDDAG